jgi:hypothetical protein
MNHTRHFYKVLGVSGSLGHAEVMCASLGGSKAGSLGRLAASATALAATLLLRNPADGNAQGPTTGRERAKIRRRPFRSLKIRKHEFQIFVKANVRRSRIS